MAEQAAQEPKGPLPAVQRQDAADGARLADAPRVRNLGELGRQLNARPPQPAQRALTGGISGGAPIQGKFRFLGAVLKTDALLEENPPEKVRPYITSDTVYDVRDD